MIIVTIMAILGLAATVFSTMFGTYMAAFAADDPNATGGAVLNIMLTVWGIGAIFVLMLVLGVAGGWIAYRKGRSRLSFVLSLLAAAPLAIILLAVVALVLINVLWSANL